MIRFILTFAVLLLITAAGMVVFGIEFSKSDYWDHHGVLLLVALTFFPRLALLFSSIPFGGFFYWLGFLFCPRILVAVLATLTYWPKNPILVTIAWMVALGGETTEKIYIRQKVARQPKIIDVEAVEVKRHPSSEGLL